MNIFAKTSLALIASLVIGMATAAGSAWAQPEPDFGGCPGMMGGSAGMMRGDPQQRWEQMQQRHAQRMQELEKQLNLKVRAESCVESFHRGAECLDSVHAWWLAVMEGSHHDAGAL